MNWSNKSVFNIKGYILNIQEGGQYKNGLYINLSLDVENVGTVSLDINNLGAKNVCKINSLGEVVNINAKDLKKKKNIPPSVVNYLQAQTREKIQSLNELLNEKNWLGTIDNRLKKIRKKLRTLRRKEGLRE